MPPSNKKKREVISRAKRAPAAQAADDGRSATSSYVAWAEHSWVLHLLVLVGFAAFVHSRVLPMVSDADSFYHLQHAAQYQANGWFDSAFPWAQYSVVNTSAADIWYGYHLLLIPLTLFEPLLNGLYVGAFLTTVVSMSLMLLAFVRLQVRWPLLWVFFLALISSDLLYRLTMLRPHPLSLGLNLLLFSYMVTRPTRRVLAVVFAVALALSWIHLALIWLPLFIVGTVSLLQLLHKRMPDWRRLAAFAAGLTLGALLRPHPLGGLYLASQVVQLMIEKQAKLPLGFGIELYPYTWHSFVEMFLPATALLLIAAGLLLVRALRGRLTADEEARVAASASLLIAIVFFALTFIAARRSHELFFGFATIFLSVSFGQLWPAARKSPSGHLLIPAAVLACLGAPLAFYQLDTIVADSFHPARFQGAGEWLRKNAKPGEIVFHTHWDRFGELFFWNPQNYYINGMDPIFAYAYDPTLCWKNRYFELDAVEDFTCGAFPCTDEHTVGAYESLKRDFRASYMAIEVDRNPNLIRYVSSTPQFTQVFESSTGVRLYRVN